MITVFRTEWKLLIRHWGIWVVAAGGLLLALSISARGMARLPFWIDESYLRFYLLGPLLLTVASAARFRSDRVAELIGAMPYRPAEWVLGRYLANFAVWLIVSAFGWILIGLSISLKGAEVDAALLVRHWLVAAPVSVGVTTAVGFALGHLPWGSILGFLGAMAYYFAGIMVPMLTGNAGHPWIFLDWLAPQHWLPLSAAGYFPNGALVLWNRVCAAGLAVALVAAVLWLLARRRQMRVLVPLAVMVLACGTATVGAGASQWVLAERDREAATEASLWSGRPVEAPVGGAIAANRYELAAHVEPDTHVLSVTGHFDVTNTSSRRLEELELTLRANFEVEGVSVVPGQDIAYTRKGDLLTVQFPLEPNETVRLKALWRGKVWDWRGKGGMTNWGSTLAAHVGTDSILLPATYGWYPLPLRASLAATYGRGCQDCVELLETEDLSVQAPPAAFTLQVTGTDLNVVSNAGEQVPGLYFVGTLFRAVEQDGLEWYVSGPNRSSAAAVVAELKKRGALLNLSVQPERVIELPAASAYGWEYGLDQLNTPGAVLVRDGELEAAAKGELRQMGLGPGWWQDPKVPLALRSGTSMYLDVVLTGHRWNGGGEDPITKVSRILEALDKARGRDVAMAVVRDLRSRTPGAAEFQKAVEAAAKGDEAVMAKLARLKGTRP